MYHSKYDVQAKQEEMMRQANRQRLTEEVQKTESIGGFRRAIELLIGMMQPPSAPAPRREPERVKSARKFATDSGIHRIR